MSHQALDASSLDGRAFALAAERDEVDRLVEALRRAFEAPLSGEQARALADLAERAARAIRERRGVAALARDLDAARVDLDLQAGAIRRLARERAMARRVLSAAGAGLWECRLADERLEWSPQVYDLFGFRPGRALHREDTVGCYAPASRAALEAARTMALKNGGAFRLDAEIETATSERRWIRLNGIAELERGVPARLYGLKQDVTVERAEMEAALRLSEVDALTGLANRRLFERTLGQLSACAGAALVLVDLDGFKRINDTFGHLTGDECLKEASSRLATAAHGASLVARIGGDEFAVLYERGLNRAELARRAAAMTEALRIPVARGDFALEIGASAGLALSDGGAPADWTARADLALYAAKAEGRGAFRISGSATAPRRDVDAPRVAV